MMDGRNEKDDLKVLAKEFFKRLMIDNCEYGGIGIDDKRPFGNSDVCSDMLELLQIDHACKCRNCGNEYSEEQVNYVDKLYKEKLIPYLQDISRLFFERGQL